MKCVFILPEDLVVVVLLRVEALHGQEALPWWSDYCDSCSE